MATITVTRPTFTGLRSHHERARAAGRWRAHLRPHRTALATASLLTVAETAFDLLVPWPLKLVVDNAVGHHHVAGWLTPLTGSSPVRITVVAALATLLIAAASGVCMYLAVRLVAVAGQRIAETLRGLVFDRLLTLNLAFHDEHRSPELVNRLTSDVARVQTALTAWADIAIPQGLTLAGILTVLILVNPALAAAAALVAPPLLALTIIRRRRVQDAEQHARDHTGRMSAFTGDLLRNVRAVTAFNEHAASIQRFGQVNTAMRRAHTNADVLEARFSPLADVILAFGTGTVLLVGASQVRNGRISLGTMLVLLSYVAMMYAPIRSLARLGSTFARGNASRRRLNDILDSPQALPHTPAPRQLPAAASAGREVTLTGVTFAYQPGRPVVQQLTAAVPPGSFTCLVGPSGAGKSTLLSLLLRLHDPDEGSITIDGIDLRQLDPEQLRAEIAFVPQDSWLIDATLGDNLRWGAPQASDREAEAALRTCGLGPWFDRLPDGLATELGDGGARLSGGERRRLALARAMLRPSSILLLDEPTSGLDVQTEKEIINTIDQLRFARTVIAVTHRLALTDLADQVLALPDPQSRPVAFHHRQPGHDRGVLAAAAIR